MQPSDSATWINYISAFGSIATPILIVILSAVGWRIRIQLERNRELEEKLRIERIKIYNDLIRPFIILFSPEQKNKSQEYKEATAAQHLLTTDYRRVGFELALLGSDAVIKAYNDLMQHFFQATNSTEPKVGEMDAITKMIILMGNLLLEIRKSMGNEKTKLTNVDMLEWFISDARKLIK